MSGNCIMYIPMTYLFTQVYNVAPAYLDYLSRYVCIVSVFQADRF